VTQSLPQPTTAGSPPRGAAAPAGRWTTFAHSVAFVLGFTTVFVILGSAVGFLGHNLNVWMPLIQKMGAVLLVIFAFITVGLVSRLAAWLRRSATFQANPAAQAVVNVLEWVSALMYTERRVTDMHSVNRNWGYASSFVLGVSFSAGWVPCVGPILASIFFLASDSATVLQGAGLLAIYSLGLGIPFLITGLALNRMSPWLRRLNQHAGIISLISGLFMLYVAWLLWFDRLGSLTTHFAWLNSFVLNIENSVSAVSGTGGNIVSASMINAAPLAFFAGLISFISPCVLPLVPAYIGYLTGASVGSRK
jgi:cytochrome c-type biogenesis protein